MGRLFRSNILGLWLAGALTHGCGPAVGVPGSDDSGSSDGTTGSQDDARPPDPSGPMPGTSTTSTTTSSATADATSGPLDSSTGDPDTGDDSMFLPAPDVPNIGCSTVLQDCPEGEKCNTYRDGVGGPQGTRCVPVAPNPRGVGEPCLAEGSTSSGIDDCDAGSTCTWFVMDTLEGVCMPFCSGTDDAPTCPNPCDWCLSNEGIPSFCVSGCDPLVDDCGPGFACTLAPFSGFECRPTPPEVGGIGEPCESLFGCADGTGCVSATESPVCGPEDSCCSPFCSLDAPDSCATMLPGTVCTPVEIDPDACQLPVGICKLPR